MLSEKLLTVLLSETWKPPNDCPEAQRLPAFRRRNQPEAAACWCHSGGHRIEGCAEYHLERSRRHRSGRSRSIFNLVKERLLSFARVLGTGLFLLTSLIVNTWISAAGKYLSSVAPPPRALIQIADWIVSFGLITALFAFIFKVLPDVRLKWGDVGAGAVLTSLLFTAGKILLGIYLGRAGFADSYGAAGSLVVLLVWVYYSAQVVFLGAEFTRAYALRFGSMFAGELEPSPLFAESCVRP